MYLKSRAIKAQHGLAVAMLSIIIFLSSCGSDSNSKNSAAPLSEKNPIITGVPTVAANQFGLVDYKLQLKQPAFDQTFLLNTSVISGPPAPTGSAFANKLVYFKRRGGSVGLFESLDGKIAVARTSLASEILLAEFPILNNYQDGSVLIDFNKGMKLFYQKDGMRAGESRERPETATPVQISYVRDAYIKGVHFYISQVARVENNPAEIRYALSTYAPDPNFIAKKADETNSVGYFQIPKVIEEGTGEESNFITKFNEKEKIVFHLTQSIPADYLQAVKDGVLYWNKAFDQEIMEVKMLPSGVTIHEPGYNVVQWLEWDNAGFAYANLHADPLTGQTMQAFIYMTSVFSVGGIEQAKRLLRRFNSDKLQTPERTQHIFIDGFKSRDEECQTNPKWALKTAMLELSHFLTSLDSDETLTESEKEALFLRFAQDYVREVVAHEIGHALGLRHNFAGSLENTVKPKFYDRLSKAYFFTGELPNGQVPNSSVMDYTPGVLAAMVGSIIRNGSPALPYDKAAIQWGYTDKKVSEMDIPTFCTDSKASGTYVDCLRFDYFSDVFDGSFKEWKMSLEGHSFSLVSRFNFLNDEDYKKKNHSRAKMLRDIQQVSLDPSKTATAFYTAKKKLLSLATDKTQLISIRKKYPENMGLIEQEEYAAELQAYKQKRFDQLGGFSQVFFQNLSLETQTQEDSNLARPFLLKIINDMNEEFQLRIVKDFESIDPTFVEIIQDRVSKYFEVLEKEYLIMELKDLKELKPIVTDENFTKDLKEFSANFLNTKSDQIIGTIGEVENQLTLHDYYFNYVRADGATKKHDLRKMVLEILKQNFYPDAPSFERAMKPIREEFKAAHKKLVEDITAIVSEDDLSAEIYDWLEAEKKRFSAL